MVKNGIFSGGNSYKYPYKYIINVVLSYYFGKKVI